MNLETKARRLRERRTEKTKDRTLTTATRIKSIDEEKRKITLSFSSEEPDNSGWRENEILRHDTNSVDLTRLLSLGTVLFNHGRDPLYGYLPVAKIADAWIDETERKGYAEIIFDTDEKSETIFQKVKSGTLKGVSVGASILNREFIKSGSTSADGRFTGECTIFTKWEPFEISLTPIPADPTVGVGKSTESEDPQMGEENKKTDKTQPEGGERTEKTIPPAGPEKGAEEASQEVERALQAERTRIAEITSLCRCFTIEPEEYITKGMSLEETQAEILKRLQKEKPPVKAPAVEVTADENDKRLRAITDAMILRGGIQLEKPAEGACAFTGISLKSIAVDCLKMKGVSEPHLMDADTLYRAIMTPDSQFLGILSNAVSKTMATEYRAASTTFQAWTKKGSVNDFKEAEHYQISEAGELLPRTQNGESKMDELTDQKVTKTVATYSRKFGFTREVFINDDIGYMPKITAAYARAAARGLNKLVYQTLCKNKAIYDKKALFDKSHNNLIETDGLTTKALSDGRKAMRMQKNLRGEERLNITPAYLIVPAALETEAEKLIYSIADPEAIHSGVTNVFRNKLQIIAEAELDQYSEKQYYLAANPFDVDTIEVTYLRGQETPMVQRWYDYDSLSTMFHIVLDYGVNVLDYRGLVRIGG